MPHKLAKDIVFLSAKRTAFGTFNGKLTRHSATDLGVHTAKAALEAAGVSPDDVDHVIYGNVLQTSNDAIYLARHVGLKAGIPVRVPALTLNRLCGSGFQAVVSAAEQILTGQAKVVLAGGTESMSQAPHVVHGLREGQRFGKNPEMKDLLWECLVDSYTGMPMAITAENLAVKYGISRTEADAFAVQSQQRWAAAQDAGKFADEITPITLKTRKGEVKFAVDEHPRRETTVEGLAKLNPVFKKDGLVNAGNASGICDGAASLVVADARWAESRGLKPLARLIGWGVAGCDPHDHGHRAGAGGPPGLRDDGARRERHGPRRGQRGLRAPIPRRRAPAWAAARDHQRQRRGHRHRAPLGGQRDAPDGDDPLRAQAARRALRAGLCVHRWWTGDRRHRRGAVRRRRHAL
jgi:acetyl-CoA acyltransferase 2